MAANDVVGVFGDDEDALLAKAELVKSGLPAHRVVISTSLTADGIAAEAPGQSFGNQPGHGRSAQTQTTARLAAGSEVGQFEQANRTGACIVTVDASAEFAPDHIERILTRCGARGLQRRPY